MKGLELHLETTGFCNAACRFCVYPSAENAAKPKGQMDWDLFVKIMNEAATIPQFTSVTFAGLAEPLMDPKIVERVSYARSLRSDWRINIFTNGIMLTPVRFDALLDAGVSVFVISLNAVSAEQHERIMGVKGKYDTVISNIDYAIAHAGSSRRVEVHAVYSKDDFTWDDVMTFDERWGRCSNGQNGFIVNEMNWADQLGRTIRAFDPDSCCFRAMTQTAVHWDGRVMLCCLDPMVKYKYGDLRTQTIKEIFNSTERNQLREWHVSGQASKHPLCKVCTRI